MSERKHSSLSRRSRRWAVSLATLALLGSASGVLAGQAIADSAHSKPPIGTCPNPKYDPVSVNDPALLGSGPSVDHNGNGVVCFVQTDKYANIIDDTSHNSGSGPTSG